VLVFGGTAPNTFADDTLVNASTLELGKNDYVPSAGRRRRTPQARERGSRRRKEADSLSFPPVRLLTSAATPSF
jgi:hypothetical protein